MKIQKRHRDLHKQLVAMGYAFDPASKNHLKYRHPCGAMVVVAQSASDPRSHKNCLSDARRELRQRQA